MQQQQARHLNPQLQQQQRSGSDPAGGQQWMPQSSSSGGVQGPGGSDSLNSIMMSFGMPDSPEAREEYESMMLKRKRTTQACDGCNKKKIKCDGDKPVCGNCTRAGLVCSYSRNARKRGPRSNYIESLENRLKEMEALLRPMEQQSPETSQMGTSSYPDPQADERRGPRSRVSGASQSPELTTPSPPPSGTVSGIPHDATRELLDIFFHYVYPFISIIHQNTFMANYANESPLLLNAMYSLAARFSTHPSIRVNPDAMYTAGDVFYIKARQLVDHYMDVPTTSTVTALLLLATYAAGSGRGSAAWMYSGMAIRMAQELKLNIEPEFEESLASEGLSWLDREIRRRLWWMCFIIDRYAGAAADRSMIINEKDCNVYLPAAEKIWRSIPAGSQEPAFSPPSNEFLITVVKSTDAFTPGVPNQNEFSYFVLLTKIFGKVVDYANSFKPSQKSGTGGSEVYGLGGGLPVLPNVRTAGAGSGSAPSDSGLIMPQSDLQLSVLDASLKEWFSNLPDSMKSFGYEFSSEVGSEAEPSWNVPYLHIFYHTCLILLYRPKMMASFHDGPLPSVQYTTAFLICRSSANEVSSNIRKIRTSNPSFFYMTPFLAFCVFQSGLIHVMAGHLSSSSEIVEESIQNAELHVLALEGVSKYWFMAGRLHTILKSFIESAKSARNGSIWGSVSATAGSGSVPASINNGNSAAGTPSIVPGGGGSAPIGSQSNSMDTRSWDPLSGIGGVMDSPSPSLAAPMSVRGNLPPQLQNPNTPSPQFNSPDLFGLLRGAPQAPMANPNQLRMAAGQQPLQATVPALPSATMYDFQIMARSNSLALNPATGTGGGGDGRDAFRFGDPTMQLPSATGPPVSLLPPGMNVQPTFTGMLFNTPPQTHQQNPRPPYF
ncbi:fungal-specific transcription factor domain-containing protein [Zopfochytrium polystomum]|nr:fungal-specific transcription factor domain-containing protein [Zopfochytrium polystomum]